MKVMAVNADFVCVRRVTDQSETAASDLMAAGREDGGQADFKKLALFSLALLCPVTSYPHSSATVLPSVDVPELKSALLHLQAALDDPKYDWLVQPDEWADWPQDPQLTLVEPGEEEALLRAQRGDLAIQPLSPFPGSHSLESMHYQDGGDGEDGGKRNEALTSIAGGLQAVSREKGGFGFRFGRKRLTGWMDEGRGRSEENKWK
ncbi:hypothetical protein D5F01_LYC19977 [Larimichthys crocea]|uniref:Uncharacterized protein n=1 Tax=Larimichthys crocea TaxID=215358 RepID=A0A6G0HUB6_LARCR|nr:hypothetical protein D5F01_LYC19977 [Larimichthys crocea]